MAESCRYMSLQPQRVLGNTGAMSHRVVAIAAFDGVEVLDVAGPAQVFSAAARLLTSGLTYKAIVLGSSDALIRCAGGIGLTVDAAWGSYRGPIDTLIVPGALTTSGPGVKALVNADLVEWLKKPRAQSVRRLVSVCAGAHTLAAAGLLDGRRATTHWATAEQLRANYPEIDVQADSIFIRDGDVWTSAGVTAGMDLALALVANDHGEKLARLVARWLVMYLRRPGGQSQFSSLIDVPLATDSTIADLQGWIPAHLTDDLSVSALAGRSNLSVRHFARLFRTQIGMPPGEFVEIVRCETAARHLLDTGQGLDSIAAKVGFGSVETLHRVFRYRYGISPGAYRSRFTSVQL
jgi:transcriptional regulator GlxA family with amidase domain